MNASAGVRLRSIRNYVVLHLVVVAVEVVGGDVEQHGYVGFEVIHVVELETAEFHYVDIVRLACYLVCQRISYVAGQPGVDSGVGQYVVCQHGGGGFAVAACDTHHLGVGVSACQFYLADYRYVLCLCSSHGRSVERYARAFYDFVGGEYAFHRVPAFLEFDMLGFEHVAIAG